MKKYTHLLLAVDVYENDEALIAEAVKLAKIYDSQLSLVHVAPQIISSVPFAYDFQDAVVEHAKTRLAAMKKKFALKDGQVFLRQGRPEQEIILLAKELKVDLIICGSHGKHGLELILGSTANGILHLAGVDVLTIRTDVKGARLVPFPYKNIVVAVELSPDNKLVRERAVELAKNFGATLHLIHAVAEIGVLGYYPAVDFDFSGEARKAVNTIVAKEGIPVDPKNIHIVTGFPKQEILDLTHAIKAELIVVGNHGHTALASAVLGSTANAVLHGARSDIMVVRV